jgi:hypothetical protein
VARVVLAGRPKTSTIQIARKQDDGERGREHPRDRVVDTGELRCAPKRGHGRDRRAVRGRDSRRRRSRRGRCAQRRAPHAATATHRPKEPRHVSGGVGTDASGAPCGGLD